MKFFKNSVKTKIKTYYQSQNILQAPLDGSGIVSSKLENNFVKLSLLQTNGEGASSSLEIQEIFSTSPHILITGEHGSGKTVLIQHIKWMWSNDKLWKDKFDCIIHIRMENLLQEDWISRQAPGVKPYDLNKYPLASFVHSSLQDQKLKTAIKLQDLHKWIMAKDGKNTLLLIDGLEMISSLVEQSQTAKIILDRAIALPNVVATSRSSGVSPEIKTKFGTILQDVGFDNSGIKLYIENHFKEQESTAKEILQKILAHNVCVRDMCKTPINLAFACMVMEDKKVQEKVSGGFSLNAFYEGILVYLGKRYLQKYEHKYDVTQISSHDIFSLEVMKYLEKIAFKGFSLGKSLIDSKLIKEEIVKHQGLTIEQVNQLGIFLAETEGRDFTNQNHLFSHVTFQEYLQARYLMNGLLSDPEQTADFIAHHRYDERYLQTLKFLAGMLGESSAWVAHQRFLEAITCDIDGEIEIGISHKVKLWMHLVQQEGLQKNLNLNQMKKIIDAELARDIYSYIAEIAESGYELDNFVKSLLEKLEELWTTYTHWNKDFSIAIDAIVKIASKTQLYKDKVLDIIETALIRAKEEQLKKDEDGSGEERTVLFTEKLKSTIGLKILPKILESLCNDEPEKVEHILTLLYHISGGYHISGNDRDELIITTAKSLGELAKHGTIVADEICAWLNHKLRYRSHSDEEKLRTQESLITIFPYILPHMRHESAVALLSFFLAGNKKTHFIETMLCTNWDEKNTHEEDIPHYRYIGAKILAIFVKGRPAIAGGIFPYLKPLLSYHIPEVKKTAILAFTSLAKARPSLAYESIEELKRLSSDKDQQVVKTASDAIEAINNGRDLVALPTIGSEIEIPSWPKENKLLEKSHELLSKSLTNTLEPGELAIIAESLKLGSHMKYCSGDDYVVFEKTKYQFANIKVACQFIQKLYELTASAAEPFVNSGSGMKVSSREVAYAFSIVDEKIKIGKHGMYVSMVEYKETKLFLIEFRDLFGRYHSWKISNLATPIELVMHPSDLANESLRDKVIKQIFEITSNKISVLDYSLATTIVTDTENAAEFIHHLQNTRETASIQSFLQDIGLELEFPTPKYYNLELLRAPTEFDRKMSVAIASLNHARKEMREVRSEIDQIKSTFAQTVKAMDSIMKQETTKLAAAQQIQLIEMDPYMTAFYLETRSGLNNAYLAACTIDSNMVANDQRGNIGVAAGVLEQVSGLVPMFGPAVHFVALALQAVDSHNQKQAIKRYAHITADSNEMARLSELLARKLALAGVSKQESENVGFLKNTKKLKAALQEKLHTKIFGEKTEEQIIKEAGEKLAQEIVQSIISKIFNSKIKFRDGFDVAPKVDLLFTSVMQDENFQIQQPSPSNTNNGNSYLDSMIGTWNNKDTEEFTGVYNDLVNDYKAE